MRAIKAFILLLTASASFFFLSGRGADVPPGDFRDAPNDFTTALQEISQDTTVPTVGAPKVLSKQRPQNPTPPPPSDTDDGNPGFMTKPGLPPPRELVIFNANVGFPMPTSASEADINKAGAYIRAANPDIVFLQEAFWGQDAKRVVQAAGLPYWMRGPRSPANNPKGSGGAVIASKYPFQSYTEQRYSDLVFPDDLTCKGVQLAIINLGMTEEFGKKVYWQIALANTHMQAPYETEYNNPQRRSNIREYLAKLKEHDVYTDMYMLPMIAAGDFNAAKKGWAVLDYNTVLEYDMEYVHKAENDYRRAAKEQDTYTYENGGRSGEYAQGMADGTVTKTFSRSGRFMQLKLKGFYEIPNPINPEDHSWKNVRYSVTRTPSANMPLVTIGANLMAPFPNPATEGYIKVAFRTEKKSSVSLAIFDTAGKQVLAPFSGKAYDKGEAVERLDISGLSSGAYFIRLLVRPDNGAEELLSHRFIVVK